MLRAWLLAVAIAVTPGLLDAGGLAAPAAPGGDPRPAALSATGTIQRFDAATHLLTLKTTRGSESFVVAESTTIHRGAKVATPQDLGRWNGSRAKVRYTESGGGRRTASSVMIGAH
jgi:hypothetical protein